MFKLSNELLINNCSFVINPNNKIKDKILIEIGRYLTNKLFFLSKETPIIEIIGKNKIKSIFIIST